MKANAKSTLYGLTAILILFVCMAAQSTTNSKTKKPSANPAEKSADLKYEMGQVWSYNARPNEEKSTFLVLKIDDTEKDGKIIHISVRGLKIKNPRSSDGFVNAINHLPFAEKSIDKSALKLLKEKQELPKYKNGYEIWREAYDKGRAGFYTIEISKVIEDIEKALIQ